MIPGVKIEMGGTDWTVPALTLNHLRRLQPRIAVLTSDDPVQVMNAMCELVVAALSRNYPDMTIEKVGDLIDLTNREAVLDAIMGKSGAPSFDTEELMNGR